ncbi:MAG: F0F1 ATP synthase subunit B' [Paracoccaceae bacterium]
MATETEAAGAVAEGAEHAAKAVGMPQLDISTFPNQIFWLVVTIVLIWAVLNFVSLPRIAGVLSDRAGRIKADIAAAEDLKQKAVEAEKAYIQALADARAEAAKIVAAARAEIQKDLDAATAQADIQIAAKAAESTKRIGEIRAGAMTAVGEVARDTAAAIVAALGQKAEGAAVNAAVAERMKG